MTEPPGEPPAQAHQKIRFRRHDIASLKTFPSAEGQDDLMAGQRPLGRRLLRGAVAALVAVVVLFAVAAGGLLFLGLTGVGSDRLRREAEAAIHRFAGMNVAATVGSTSLSLDSSRFIALEIRDVKFADAAGSDMLNAGVVRFGVRFWPLMSGQIRLGSATLEDARLLAAAMPSRQGGGFESSLANADGLIDPDRVLALLFGALQRAFDTMEVGSTRAITLEKVEIVLPEGGRMKSIMINHADLRQRTDGRLSIAAAVQLDRRSVAIQGTAARDNGSKRIAELMLKLTAAAPAEAADAGGTPRADPNKGRFGSLDATLSGSETRKGGPAELKAEARLADSVLDLGTRGQMAGDIGISASLKSGAGAVKLNHLSIATGGSSFDFQGTVGPAEHTSDPKFQPTYRFQLASLSATLAPVDTDEPALGLTGTVAGNYEPRQRLLSFDRLDLKTAGGELLGTGSLQFASAGPPGIFLALSLTRMPVGQVKQLWPWFSAPGTRNWVLDNLISGGVVDSNLQYRVEPGRLGNGVALGRDEVFGTFNVENAEFNTTGELPRVRDAQGSVNFHGGDVDIHVTSGRMVVSQGEIATSNATLTIRPEPDVPVIGKLDVDISGPADAVAAVASLRPIRALQRTGLAVSDFSGDVAGHVRTDVPIQPGIDAAGLDWLVSLKFDDLAIAKPFEGQSVTDADGTLVVDPAQAKIDAKARLNGAPAQITMLEPLKPGGPARERRVRIALDDRAREALAPGLGDLLTGPVTADVSIAPDNTQSIEADLSAATLNVPWAGWSKGPGVAAKVDFVLRKSGDTTRLDDFDLSGKSFAVSGNLAVGNGSLTSADFDRVKLNRDDDFSLSLKRAGKGYAVDIRGDALDARPVIKQFTSESGGGSASGSNSKPVTLDARLDKVLGFNGESLSGVQIDYSGVGSRVLKFSLVGTTRSGAPVSIDDSSSGGRRKLAARSANAGALLRFLDIYEHMQGGTINVSLAGKPDGALRGEINATNFVVVNEPRLRSIVSTPSPASNGASLNDAVKRNIDTSKVTFDRGYAIIDKGPGSLKIQNGVLRGPLIGTTFQGTLYDPRGQMAMTGTFMPAYGLNRLFGELPLVGLILGNGRDRGLIGVTYKLSGNAKSPDLQINPLSVIAPGIFRSIFEFR